VVSNEPAIEFPALIASVKCNQTGDGEVSINLKVPAVYAEKALSLGLFIGAYFERVAFWAPSKEQQA
jgi:hypothetical protein